LIYFHNRIFRAAAFFSAALFAFLCSDQVLAQTQVERLVEKIRDEKIYLESPWLRLGHYRSKTFDGYESEALGPAFFFANDGKFNPQAELEATLRAIFSNNMRSFEKPQVPRQIARCQFPARTRWLMQRLAISEKDLPAANCPEFDEFRNRLSAKSATLVFSSYYVNNPSSSFGHTLLRLNRDQVKDRTGADLNDIGVNYAANPTTQNPILYAYLGMVGGFTGSYAILPYYYKVREYSDFESRDLWEYDLNLSQEEVDQAVNHIWEMGSTYFDYFYLAQNCSYHILRLLDVAAPRLSVSDRVPFYVIPIDSVRAVTKWPDLVSNIHFRPSIHTQVATRASQLSRQERAIFFEMLESDRSLENLKFKTKDEQTRARIADTLLDGIDFRHHRELLAGDEDLKAWKRRVLIERSRLPSTEPLKFSPLDRTRPDDAHRSARFSLGWGQDRFEKSLVEAEMRFALHDLMDPPEGYPQDAEVEFARLRLRYSEQNEKLSINELRLLSVSSIPPVSRLSPRASWRFRAGASQIFDRRCDGCVAVDIDVLGGVSSYLLESSQIAIQIYSLLGPSFEYSPRFKDVNALPVLLWTSGFRVRLAQRIMSLTEFDYKRVFDRDPFDSRRLNIGLRWSPDLVHAVDLRLRYDEGERRPETLFSYMHYF